MRVPEGGVGDAERLLLAQGAGETLRPEGDQSLARAVRRRQRQVDGGQLVVGVHRGRAVAVGLVDGDVGQIGQDLGATVG